MNVGWRIQICVAGRSSEQVVFTSLDGPQLQCLTQVFAIGPDMVAQIHRKRNCRPAPVAPNLLMHIGLVAAAVAHHSSAETLTPKPMTDHLGRIGI